ncbi:hypothetical protein BCY86_07025 [Pajaroellobacter abortibovis]|uniref:FBD domain-containing protein n=1 Tax=Pajaroellobacter abortibovis TaxID=1882918 RepID=A0A1L6MY29_9BACT|nr:hypothetical protein BCY86_07025 [Pajaroellobacter abortibovis]
MKRRGSSIYPFRDRTLISFLGLLKELTELEEIQIIRMSMDLEFCLETLKGMKKLKRITFKGKGICSEEEKTEEFLQANRSLRRVEINSRFYK